MLGLVVEMVVELLKRTLNFLFHMPFIAKSLVIILLGTKDPCLHLN